MSISVSVSEKLTDYKYRQYFFMNVKFKPF